MQLVETAPHEFAAHFLFTEHGLAPFFACDRRIKEGDGSQRATFTDEGEEWEVTLFYRDSGLAHPGATLPTGTAFQLKEMREFEFHIRSSDDPVGEHSMHAHIAPRWQGMKSKNGQEISVPDDLDEGVNLHVQGSNIEFARYQPLIQASARAVGINPDYFSELHEFSTILNAERYVRIHKEESGPVHARDGPIAQLGHLLENDREGRRKLVQYDSDERGRKQPGYYHTATLGPRRIREAFPDHELPKEVKHYYIKEAASLDSDRPIAHPKVGVSYQKSFWDDQLDRVKLGMRRSSFRMPMAEIDCLSESTGWIDLAFMERERTPEQIVEVGIQLHLAGLSLSNTKQHLEKLGVKRSRTAIHNWVQKADLQPVGDGAPNQIALDETVIRINDERHWLYAAVDPQTNEFLHVRLFQTRTTQLTVLFLRELRDKQQVEQATFLVDDAAHLKAALDRLGLRFQMIRHGNRNAVKRVFREVKRRTSSFSNTFSNVAPPTAESWLQAFAVWWNRCQS